MNAKEYPLITGVTDALNNETTLSVVALPMPSASDPAAWRIVIAIGNPGEGVDGVVSCGVAATERLIGTLRQAVDDVRVASGKVTPEGLGGHVPALWFDKQGCGPSELAIELRPFPSERNGAIPAMLGLRIRVGDQNGGFVYGDATDMVDGGFLLHVDQVREFHHRLALWLADQPTSPAAG